MGRDRRVAGELNGLHVLVVDDEVTSRNAVTTILSHHGALVTEATSAHAALESLDRLVPEVIVYELTLGVGQDDYRFLAQLRARSLKEGGRVPVVAITTDSV